MRVSEQWLRQWVNPPVATEELAQQLTMAGLEVDFIEPAAADFTQVVVGKIVELEQHPDAQRLRVAKVDIGSDALLQIVCGAPNVSIGMCAPTALVGASLPGIKKLKAAKLRGMASQGMLCSAKELGLGEDSDGLLELPGESQPGLDLRELLVLNDQVIEVDLTPNRGDCLGMAGIAREVSVLNRLPLTAPEITPVKPQIDDTFPIQLSDPAACPRFVARVVKNIDPSAASPLWLIECLRRAGIRTLGPVVDITNYVMLELNHPMHAYDLNQLQQGIEVRLSRKGESVELLNGQTVELDDDTLLITDERGPIGLAGIMGGATTEVSDNTTNVLFECAFFSPEPIAGKARRFGLHTDASHRFERGVDPHGQMRAVERATQLLLDIAGGQPGPLIDNHSSEQLPQSRRIHLRHQRISLVLGVEVESAEVEDILQRLGMQIEAAPDGWQVNAPSWRFDMAIEEDLIEEIGRIRGYDLLPVNRPAAHLQLTDCPEQALSQSVLREVLLQRDYQEVITYTFVDSDWQQALDPQQSGIPLANPIAADMSVMRSSLWPGLIKALAFNQKRQQNRIRLCEVGLNFQGSLDNLVQESHIGGIACGDVYPEQWGTERRSVDFFDIKGDVEALLTATGYADECRFVADQHPALHPGQSARIDHAGITLGWVGTLHPKLARQLELEGNVFLFELNIARLAEVKPPEFAELSKFPASRRDLALLVDETVSVAQIKQNIREQAGEILRELILFDVYRGRGIPEGQKSLAFGLILQDFSSNLTDQAIEQVVTRILSGVQHQFGAQLRSE